MPILRDEWYIIVNPHAGSGKTMSKWVPAEKLLHSIGVPFYTVYTNYKHHAVELAATAARLGYRKIAAVGGDGSLHEIFNGILRWCSYSGTDPEDFYVAVFPIGSGNDWIKAFNIPNDTEDVVKILAKGDFCKEDVVRVTPSDNQPHYMANVGGIGFDSHVCSRVNAQKERGMRNASIYFKSLLYTIFHFKPIRISVSREGNGVYSAETLSIAMGNGKYSGGGMRQCNLADPSDGLLDMMILPKIKMPVLLGELPRLLKGTTSESSVVTYLRGTSFDICPLDSSSADIIELDGEIIGTLPARIELTGQKINVLCNREQ